MPRTLVTDPSILQAFGAPAAPAPAPSPAPEAPQRQPVTNPSILAAFGLPGQPISKTESFLRGAEQGATLGSGDEIRGDVANGSNLLSGAMTEAQVRASGRPLTDFEVIGGARGVGKLYQPKGTKAASIAAGQQATEANRQANDAASAANPWTFGGGKLAGALVPAIVAAPASLSAGAAQTGAAFLPRVAAAAADAGALNAVAGAGEAKEGQRVEGAARGAGTGAALGAVGYPIAAGAGRLIGALGTNAGNNAVADALGVSRGAANRLARAATDDRLTAPQVATRSAELGPEGMIMDLSPQLTQQAEALATIPGRSQAVVLDAARNRSAGASGRITNTLDQTIGLAQGRTATAEMIEAQYRGAADPLYDEFRQTPVPWTRPLEAIVDRIKLQPDVLRKARRLNDLDPQSGQQQFFADIADDGTVKITRVPNANELDLIKQSLDDYARTGGNEGRIYGNLSRNLRDMVDQAISPGKPQDSIYYRARQAAGEGLSAKEAMEEGASIWTGQASPDEVMAKLSNLNPRARRAYQMSAANALDKVMGTSRFDAASVRRLFQQGWNQEKLAALLGQDKADKVMQRVGAEDAFQATRNQLEAGSATARRGQAQREFTNKPTMGGERFKVTDILNELPTRGLAALLRTGSEAELDRIRNEVAGVLTRPANDPAVQVLIDEAARRAGLSQAPNVTARRAVGTGLVQLEDPRYRNGLAGLLTGPR
jgi:hypothetical protein